MADFKWAAAESIATLLTTELNSLANSTSASTGKVLSASISHASDRREFLAVQLDVTYGSAPSAGGYVSGWILPAVTGTEFEDGSTTVDPQRAEDFYLPLNAVTSAQKPIRTGVPIPPFDFKILLRNKAGQSMAASGNTLKYSRYNEASV